MAALIPVAQEPSLVNATALHPTTGGGVGFSLLRSPAGQIWLEMIREFDTPDLHKYVGSFPPSHSPLGFA